MSAAAEPLVRVERISRTFRNGTGIHDITFDVQDRTVTAVIGPNGAGKTVLFSVIAGLQPADSGRIESPPGARIAYCPDVPQFESWLTAREVVETSLAVAAPRSNAMNAREALEQCGLSKVADRRVADFSRGMLQRLGIAAALVLDPEVLILDEPNSALDPIGRADVRRLIAEQRQHRCILLSSHVLSEVEQLADDLVVIADGRLVVSGTTNDILAAGRAPAWSVRLGAASTTSLDELRIAFPSLEIEYPTEALCTLGFPSFEAAAEDLVPVLNALRAPVLEVTLQDRDLDASFARIIQNQGSR
ncbi:ABC transporter ATP-binding protein [Microbacterium murale]|uniref:ABC-2 type transport system ATP-binding protein n=1 Tax=Microbacterium murale TaxID=1081040 RepID=A0ABU0PC48_9MICO|nr:ABC transporter ATP-binding protein [Microbacterium murale]MDQ0644903.1 ABC-2 type transport system ATP-binding protein [Microbacterium murale]